MARLEKDNKEIARLVADGMSEIEAQNKVYKLHRHADNSWLEEKLFKSNVELMKQGKLRENYAVRKYSRPVSLPRHDAPWHEINPFKGKRY